MCFNFLITTIEVFYFMNGIIHNSKQFKNQVEIINIYKNGNSNVFRKKIVTIFF